MSTFTVTVHPVVIEEHPNADALEIVRIGGYRSIVSKGRYKDGDLVAYIPEAAIIPEALQEELGVTGKLAGSAKNRVKAIRLRGIFSQGLIYPARPNWNVGDDVQVELGITKYEPPVPESLRGDMFNAGSSFAFKYDIENFKREPNLFENGEEVVFTEKIHGTNCRITVVPEDVTHPECPNRLWVASKGLGAQGLCFKDLPDSPSNTYMRTAKQYFTPEVVAKISLMSEPVSFFGEVYGKGIQDLHYGLAETHFRVFDIFIGSPTTGFFVEYDEMVTMCDVLGLETVPLLYRGPFSKDALDEHTNGKETVSGRNAHVREGVVIRPVQERLNPALPMGRVQLKSVSENYLLRKGKTTEYS